MKKMILALVAVFALTLGVQAQEEDRPAPGQRPNREQMAQRLTDRMAEALELTAEQKEAVLALNVKQMETARPQRPQRAPRGEAVEEGEDYAPQTLEARPEGEDNPEAALDEYNAALKEILTDEQYAKYEESARNFRPFGGARSDGPRGRGPAPREGEVQGPAPQQEVCDGVCNKPCATVSEGCDSACDKKCKE